MRICLVLFAAALGACGGSQRDLPGPEDTAEPLASIEDSLPVRFSGDDAEHEAVAMDVQKSINPLENDLTDLEVAFRLRDAFIIKPNGAHFEIDLVDLDGAVFVDEAFQLIPTQGVESAILTREVSEGFYTRTYRLADNDMARMRAVEQVLVQRKAEAPGESVLNLGGGAVSCVRPGAEPPDAYSLTMYFRTAGEVDFVPMTTEIVMERFEAGPMAEFWRTCQTQ